VVNFTKHPIFSLGWLLHNTFHPEKVKQIPINITFQNPYFETRSFL